MGRPAVPIKRRLELDEDEEVALLLLATFASLATSGSFLGPQQDVAPGVAASIAWLEDIWEEGSKRRTYKARRLFKEADLGTDLDVKILCRFERHEVNEIMRLLKIPDWLTATDRGGHKYPGKVCLLSLLIMLAHKSTTSLWSDKLGLGHPSDVSRAYLTMLAFLKDPIERASDITNYTSYFEDSAAAFMERGLGPGIFAALDGKLFRLADAQNSASWHNMTDGHNDKLGVNYISACLASGLFIIFNGPTIGCEHDSTSFRITDTYGDIQRAVAKLVSQAETEEQEEEFREYRVVADSAFPLSDLVMTLFTRNTGLHLPANAAWNKVASACRVVIEQSFGRLVSLYGRVDSNVLQLDLQPTQTMQRAALLFTNLSCTFHGSRNSAWLMPPEPREYVSTVLGITHPHEDE